MLPQLIKVLKEKDVENLSGGMIGVLLTGVSLWVVFGFMKNELPIILSNGFLLLLIPSFLFTTLSIGTIDLILDIKIRKLTVRK